MTAGVQLLLWRTACICLSHPLLPDKWEWDAGQGWMTLNLQPAWPFSSFTCKGTGEKGAGGGQEVLSRGWEVEPEHPQAAAMTAWLGR